MFSWDDFVSKPFIYFEELIIDDEIIDLSKFKYEDWKTIKRLNIFDILNTDEVTWQTMKLKVSIVVESDYSPNNIEYKNRVKMLQSNEVTASIKIYSKEAKKYFSYPLHKKIETDEFLDSPNSFIFWKGEFELSNLVFNGNLNFEPSLISQIPDFDKAYLNVGGGEGFRLKDGLEMNFKDKMIFNGSSPKIIPTSFENSDEYRKYIASKYVNSPYLMHLETKNFGEPVLFVNTDIEENKKLHSDYSDKRYSTFYDLWKFTYHNHYLYAWSEIISYAIKQAVTKENQDIESYYKDLLKKLAQIFVPNSREKGDYASNIEFIKTLKEDSSNYDIDNWLIKELDLKKTVQGVVNKQSKLDFKKKVGDRDE